MSSLALLLPAAGAAAALLALSAWRPALACALLALAVPVSAGLERGGVVLVLRVNEALLLVVTAGFLIHWLTRRRPLTFTGLDVVILGFCLANVVIPWSVILLSHDQLELDGWLVVMGPVQYLIVYAVYSRTEFTGADLRLFLNLCMLASIPVAAVAVAESLDIAGARELVEAYYPTAPLPSWDTVYRPASLLGHYSAVGAFGLLNFLLALALAATRHPGFSWWWLALVMGANLLSLIASLTYAPVAALPLGAAAVLLVARNVPWRQLAAGPPMLAACAVALWPIIGGRINAQFSIPGGFGLPETLQTRVDYWQGFFLPALIQHGPWLGTGTLIPPEVPRPLVAFVDNGYLWQLFRAGIPGLAVLIATILAVASAGWAARRSEEPSHRALGAVCLGAVASVVLIDMTSEYLTFTAVSQEFWMLVGLLSGVVLLGRRAGAAPVLELRPEPARPVWAAGLRAAPRLDWAARLEAALRLDRAARLGAALRRLAPEGFLVRASVAVLLGFGVARVLGFLFQVAAGRTLAPEGYGRFTYALAVANIAAVLLTTAPLGLSRFLSRSAGSRAEQQAYFVNWLAVVGLVLGVSAVVTAAFATPVGLGGWMLVGLLANLLGATALEMYREVQRGLGHYTLQSVFYVLANVVQLAAVLVAASLGWASPALFLIIYGLSAVVALAVMAPLSRGLGLDRALLRWRRMLGIVGFIRPVLLQAIFWNIWFSADLVLLQHLRTAAETGTYAAAKTISNGFTLVPTAIAFVFAPRVAQLAESEVRGHLVRVLGLTAVVTVPLAIGVMAVAGPLTSGVFGGRFSAAAIPLVVLAAGMVPYGLKSVLGGLWLGLGHPVVETVSSGFAMVVTVGIGLWLIPVAGPVGAAAAFSAGALAMLLVNGAVSVWAFGARSPRVRHLGDRQIIEDELPPEDHDVRDAAEAISPPALVVAEELTATPDEGYVTFVRMLETRLAARRPTLLHATPGHRSDAWKPLRAIDRIWKVVQATRRTELRKALPEVIVYVSRSSLTLPALVRGALLKRLCSGAPLAVIALQAQTGGGLARRMQRMLAPDLLFVSTERERDAARAVGLNARTISSGVDLVRFRPPMPGEKEELRRKWELPLTQRVVLHVGHLREGRNLHALVPLARSPGVTVVVAASGQRGPESEALREELEAHGVVVIDGYRPDIEELYRLADCYVFPTVAPDNALAMPLSVLEALASDLPVVSTTFGALPERFDSGPGLEFVERTDQLPERVLAACRSNAQPRRLAEPYSWDAIVGRLADLLDELRLEHGASRAAVLNRGVIAAFIRRLVVYGKVLPRLLLWRTRLGYQPREPASAPIALVQEPAPLPGPCRPDTDRVGIIGRHPDGQSFPVAAAADFLGLSVEAPAERDTEKLLDRAVAERWRLVTAPVEALAAMPGSGRAALATFVNRGGTLHIPGVDERSTGWLRVLAAQLGFSAPAVREAPRTRCLLFPVEQAAFARELAGTRLETACQHHTLEGASDQEVLAFSLSGAGRLPAVVQRRVGLGRIVLSAIARSRWDRLGDVMASDEAGAAVVPLLLLRELYGTAAWHAPVPLANFSIDDPALRRGMLGLRYDLLVAQARDHGFHVTIATVPRELALAGEAVVRRLREQPELLSACYHGCDHDGYEFYLTRGSKMRHSPRPLREQRRALWRAVLHGRRFARTHHHELDRVMVFPYGVGPATIFPDLHRLGFLASCNYGDKYPLEAPVPADPDLGVRPADLAWEGFPLLWRRGLRDGGYLLDLVLGRPVLLFAHRHALGTDYRPFVERAGVINRASRGAAMWRGLDEVARHAYLQRYDPTVGWSVLMTANEACLHNPDAAPRTYRVRRPHLLHGSQFELDGVRHAGGQPLAVTVPAGGTALLRLVAAGPAAALRGRRGCSVFPTAAHRDTTTEMPR